MNINIRTKISFFELHWDMNKQLVTWSNLITPLNNPVSLLYPLRKSLFERKWIPFTEVYSVPFSMVEIGPVVLEKKSSMYFHEVYGTNISLSQRAGAFIGSHLRIVFTLFYLMSSIWLSDFRNVNMWKDFYGHLNRQTDRQLITGVLQSSLELLTQVSKYMLTRKNVLRSFEDYMPILFHFTMAMNKKNNIFKA